MSVNSSQIIKLILAALPFTLMCLAATKTNLKKPYRGHQFLSVIYGIIFTVVGIIEFDKFSDKLLSFIKAIILKLDLYQEKYPQFASMFKSISDTLSKIDWSIYLIFIGNFILLVLFYVTKRILLPVFKKIWDNEEVYNATSGAFYQWNDSLSNFCLKSNYYAVKKLMKVYYVVATFAVILLLVLCRAYPEWPGFKAVMYPFAAIIILGEIFFFLDGMTANEYRNQYSGDDGSSSRVALYYPFKKYLQAVFGDRVIDVDTKFPGYKHNNADVLKKYENDESQASQLANAYFYKKATTREKREAEELEERTKNVTANDKDSKGVQLDEALVDATYRLMNGESVMFATPFYRDYSDYIFLPINRSLSRGNKVLFILGRNGIEEDVQNWINESLESVANVPELWEIKRLANIKDYRGDIGIVSLADIFDEKVVNDNKEFINRVTEVVMIEPSQFISTAQLSVSVYIERISKNATYYIFDKNNDGLVDTMSHVIKQSISAVTPTNRERNINTYMLWRADGDNLSHKLFPSIARYLGMGTELIISALKEQVSQGEWYAYNKFPLDEMKWISQQYYPILCDYASLPAEQDELESRMKFSHNMWGAEKGEYKYIVVEDEFCNLYEMARQFQNRGTKETFVNVISQNYLLRDYMEYNPALFVNDPKAIPNITPDFVRTNRNIAFELLLKLNSGPMFESDILKVLRFLGDDRFFEDYKTYDVKQALHELVTTYIPDVKRALESVIDERDKVYRLKKASTSDDSINTVLSNLKSVYYVVEDENEKTHYLDSKLYGQVYQSHLPGQHITIGGKYYEVLAIGGSKGVVLKRASDHIRSREYYRQIREYGIDSFRAEDKIASRTTIGDIVIDRGEADFTVKTKGYLHMKNYGDFVKDCMKNEVSGIPERSYKNKTVLRLTLPDILEKERVTVTLLFNEVFKTIFPDNCDFIAAVTNIPQETPEGMLYKLDDSANQENVEPYIYIIEDSVLDMGLIDAVERNLRRLFEIIADYLKWYKMMLLPIVKVSEEDNDKVIIDEEQIEEAIHAEKPQKKKKGFFSRLKEGRSNKGKKQPKGTEPADAPEEAAEHEGTYDSEGENEPEQKHAKGWKSLFKRKKKSSPESEETENKTDEEENRPSDVDSQTEDETTETVSDENEFEESGEALPEDLQEEKISDGAQEENSETYDENVETEETEENGGENNE